MFKNYLTVALRNFWRNKVFSLINIVGLAIGISASLVIFLIVSYDLNFDKFEKDSDRIYRVVSDYEFSGQEVHNSGVTAPMPAAMKKELTGAEIIAPFRTWEDDPKLSVPYPNPQKPVILKKEKGIVFAGEDYFNLLPYKWLSGSAKTSLSQPYQVVLTESKAKKFFPGLSYTQITGMQLTYNDSIHFTVSGIVQDIEQNTDFTFTTFFSYISLHQRSTDPQDWDDWGSTTSASQLFIKLSPGVTAAQFAPKILNLYNRHHKQDPDDHSKTGYSLQPLSDVHFNPKYGNFGDVNLAHRPTLYGLLAVAAFLLLLACINFINLTTAQASHRAREIGIRKTMGSNKLQLIIQFLSETFFITLIATILSILITPLLLKVFADFIPKGLHFSLLKQPGIILFLAILVVAVSVLSGFYPALLLSSYKPVLVLKNQAYSGTGKTRNAWMRKSLTVAQFTIAQVFIIGTILVAKQIHFTLNKDLGFKKDAIVYFNMNYNDTVKSHKSLMLDRVSKIPGVAMVSLASNPPSINSTWTSTVKFTQGKKEIETDVHIKNGDSNYIRLYGFKMLAGKNFTNSDTNTALIINNTYAKLLGFNNPQRAVGIMLKWDNKNLPVVGVIADFNQKSLHEEIRPLLISNGTKRATKINVALQPQNANGTLWKTTIAQIEKEYKQIYPDEDFEYTFLDQNIAKFYDAEKNISKLLIWSTGLTMFISCLGLLGLVMYITNQRTKEIGIRKIVGASVTQIIGLLSKDFLLLIAMAIVIAVPIAWWGANEWLSNFAYKTSLSWWVFASGGAAMLLVAFLVMLGRTLKVAMANPVDSLRVE